MKKSGLTSLPSADDFYSILLATLPVSALPADRKNYPRPVEPPAGTAHSGERTGSPKKHTRNNAV